MYREGAGRGSNLQIHVLRIGSQVMFQNDQRSYVSENLRRSTTELRRNDLHQSRAGGTRTHDIRLVSMYSNSAVDRCFVGDEVIEQIHFQVGVEPTSTKVPSYSLNG